MNTSLFNYGLKKLEYYLDTMQAMQEKREKQAPIQSA